MLLRRDRTNVRVSSLKWHCEMPTQPELLRLIDSIYEGALSDSAWICALTQLMHLVNGSGALLMIFDPTTSALVRMDNIRMDPEAMDAYDKYWVHHDPRLAPALTMPVGKVFSERSLVPERAWRSSEILNELLIPNDVSQIAATWIEKSDRRVVSLAIQRSSSAPPFCRDELNWIQGVVPHLRRSLVIKDRLGFANCRFSTVIELMDRLPFGLLLVDRDRRIIESSQPARITLARHDGVFSRSGILQCVDNRHTADLIRLIQSGSSDPESSSAGGSITIRRGGSEKPLILSVIPISIADALYISPHVAACVVIFDPNSAVEATPAVIRQSLGVSPAEARLVAALSQGFSLKEAADQLCVTINTARTQLKSVFAKTECRSQRALLAQVATSPALLRGRQRGSDPPP